MRARGCIVTWGDFSSERLELSRIGDEFGWPIRAVADAEDLRKLAKEFNSLALLIDPSRLGLSWRDALNWALQEAPSARIAMCHGVEDSHAREEMTDAGAFATLMLPLVHNEVRQFVGFVWAQRPSETASLQALAARLAGPSRLGGVAHRSEASDPAPSDLAL